MITRRKFSTHLLVTATALVPGGSLATHRPGHAQQGGGRKQCDLVVDALEWSSDGGLTWGSAPVVEDAATIFRAAIRNAGTASSPSNKVIRTAFLVDGTQVAFVDHFGGLAAGQAVTVEGDDGPTGDGIWFAGPAGQSNAVAVVDSQDAVRESAEGNNERSALLEIQPGEPVVVARDDAASTEVDTAVTIDVLANDTPPAGMELFVSSVQSPTDQGGIAVITADQKFVEYTPPAGFKGADEFIYEAIAA